MRVSVRVLEPADWPRLKDLFGERGACGGCWCMAWRRPLRDYDQYKGVANQRAFQRLVKSGKAQGTIALAGAECVGWCSVGPRADFVALKTKRSLATDWDEATWSVTCFFLHKDFRGRGLSVRLLEAAVALARDEGARRVEGYPVRPIPSLGDQMPSAFVWTGLPGTFERCRFHLMDNPPGKRPIYQRRLRPGKDRAKSR